MAKTNISNLVNIRASEGAGTTTLTASSARTQVFNPSAVRIVRLPSTNTKGLPWIIENRGTAELEVKTPDNVTLKRIIPPGNKSEFIPLTDNATTTANWIVRGGILTTPQSFTPTVSSPWTVSGNVFGKMWRDNTYLEMHFGAEITAASGTLFLPLPTFNSRSINWRKQTTASPIINGGDSVMGDALCYRNALPFPTQFGFPTEETGIVALFGNRLMIFGPNAANEGGFTEWRGTSPSPISWASGDRFVVRARVNIHEWQDG